MPEIDDILLSDIVKMIPPILFPKGKPISGNLKLEKDLSIYGDDAVDFITKFGIKYNVDISNLDYNKYFTDEIDFYFIRKLFIKSNKLDLTIDDLILAIKTGKLE